MKKNGKFQKIATVVAVITLLIVAGKITHSDGVFKGSIKTDVTYLKESSVRMEGKIDNIEDILIAEKYGGIKITQKEKD